VVPSGASVCDNRFAMQSCGVKPFVTHHEFAARPSVNRCGTSATQYPDRWNVE
jgi:hypothetical protein